MEYQVKYHSHCEITEERDPDDEWDRDNTSTDHFIEGVAVYHKGDWGSEMHGTVEFDLVPDKPYYLLYGIYSTGNSFGYDEGEIEFVDLYESVEFAEEMKQRLEKHNEQRDSDDERDSVTLKAEKSGKKIDFLVPWMGYFEHLSYVEIETVYLKEKGD